MSSNLDELRQTLKELQRELNEVGHLDDETRHRLEGVVESINDALHREDHDALNHPSIRETIDERRENLDDSSYARLTRVLGNLADILGNSGI